jgi:hypothetical protein
VRKKDLPAVASMPNWINFESMAVDLLNNLTDQSFHSAALQNHYRGQDLVKWFRSIQNKLSDHSVYKQIVSKYANLPNCTIDMVSLGQLSTMLGSAVRKNQVDLWKKNQQALHNDFSQISNKYPLIDCLGNSQIRLDALADYINLIDQRNEIAQNSCV